MSAAHAAARNLSLLRSLIYLDCVVPGAHAPGYEYAAASRLGRCASGLSGNAERTTCHVHAIALPLTWLTTDLSAEADSHPILEREHYLWVCVYRRFAAEQIAQGPERRRRVRFIAWGVSPRNR